MKTVGVSTGLVILEMSSLTEMVNLTMSHLFKLTHLFPSTSINTYLCAKFYIFHTKIQCKS